MMKIAHLLKTYNDIVFVDSTSARDPENYTITFVLAPCAAGAVPLGIIITQGQSYDAYNAGFSLLKEALPKNKSFGTCGYPQIFMTDNSSAEINALHNSWPNSRHLLCIFHVLQAVWRWLWEAKNSIPKESRKNLMQTFQKTLYADTLEKAEQEYLNTISSNYGNWNKYISTYWEFRSKWCLAWRDATINRHQTNNFSEITVRIFNDIVLSRVKAYNVISLIDFACTVLEDYYCRRFREFANSRNCKARLFLQTQSKKANTIKQDDVIQISEIEYKVTTSDDKTYEINTSVGICSCFEGQFRSFCTHQCAVYSYYDVVSKNFPPVTAEDKYNISVLAQGDKSLPMSFFDSFLPNDSCKQYTSTNNYIESTIDVQFNTVEEEETLPVIINNDNASQSLQTTASENVSMKNMISLMTDLDEKYCSSKSGLKMIESRLKKITSVGMWESFLHTAEASSKYHFVEDLELQFKFNPHQLLASISVNKR